MVSGAELRSAAALAEGRRGRRGIADAPAARRGAPAAGATRAPVVVKLGGRALEAPEALGQLAADLARLPAARVLVHGGGGEVNAWLERVGSAPRFADGLRVTDPDTLEIAVAVLAGLANKRLVARLRAAGIDAIGLAALDAGVLECAPHSDSARLGAVGIAVGARPDVLRALFGLGLLPVLASVGHHGGALLNLNADDTAFAVAGALHASDLVLLSDVPGLVLGGEVQRTLTLAALDSALAGAEVSGGMRPKLRAARAALHAGVARVHIAAWDGAGTLARLLGGSGTGTTFAAEEPA